MTVRHWAAGPAPPSPFLRQAIQADGGACYGDDLSALLKTWAGIHPSRFHHPEGELTASLCSSGQRGPGHGTARRDAAPAPLRGEDAQPQQIQLMLLVDTSHAQETRSRGRSSFEETRPINTIPQVPYNQGLQFILCCLQQQSQVKKLPPSHQVPLPTRSPFPTDALSRGTLNWGTEATPHTAIPEAPGLGKHRPSPTCKLGSNLYRVAALSTAKPGLQHKAEGSESAFLKAPPSQE